MRMQRKIILKLILFIVIFFGFGMNSQSKAIRPGSIEINADSQTNKNEISFSSDFDSSDKDQIEPSYNSALTGNASYQKRIHMDFCGVYTFSISVWQPPKIY
jgi:hypothetical protein